MRKYIVRLLLLLFPVAFAHTGFAQAIDSILAQSEPLLSEKIHIHFDKTAYNKGETVWYKIYLLHNSTDTAAVSKNVYLEWYDAEGKMIKHTAAPILISTSQGSFDIPLDYNGQSLHVKAFTRWMLNDDPLFSYRRELLINTGAPITELPVRSKTTVQAFPEGGFLIQGLNTRVAFKATNQYGNPVFIKGVLVDEASNPIDSVNTKHDGMGSFYFVPLSGKTYTLNWTDEYGAAGSTPMPVTKTEGAQISIKTMNGKARFQIRRTDNAAENFKRMVLLVHMNQITLYRVTINTSEKTTLNSEVPIGELPTGLLQFTLFTSDWIPVAERVIFINNRSHEFEAKIKADKIRVGKKEKNTLEIIVPDTAFTNMSLSITDATVHPPDQHTIFSDIFLSSEIRGKIHNPGYYLSGNDVNIAADLDLVMLTHGWRRFDWDKIKANTIPKTVHPLESAYMKLHGQVSGVKKIDTSVMLNMIVINKDSSRQFLSVQVAKDGSFEYPQVFFDTAKVYFNFNNNPSLTKDAKLQLDNSLMKPVPSAIPPGNGPPFIWNDKLAKQRLDAVLAEEELLRKRMAETTLEEVTVTTRVKTREQVVNDKYTTGFFARGNNTRVFDLTDETKTVFSRTVLEYLQSKVAGLQISGTNVGWRGDVPEFFLDEIRTDLEHILSIPMVNIAMIKTFPPIFMYATGGGRGGAIAVYTKRGGDVKQINSDIKGMENMVLAGYSKFREFYSPDYEQSSEDKSKPDNRTTLYWNPYLITNKSLQRVKIEFFNNDFTQTFNVVLEGVNAAGKMTRVVRTMDAKTKE
jgi:hypothetical protein